MKGIIYKYTFPDGKVYIGQTRRHPEKRKREHLAKDVGPTNKGFWEAFQKLGEPDYEELFHVEQDDVDELVAILNFAETFFIHQYKADNPNYGYNMKSYGTVGTKTNKYIQNRYHEHLESLLKMRMIDYDNAIHKIDETKEPLTQEEIYLLKEKYREQNVWQEHIDKYDFEHLENNDEKETVFMVEMYLDIVYHCIIQEAEEDARQYVIENYTQILYEEKSKNAILQIDKDGHVVKEFFSFSEICQAFNVPRADNVFNVLKGRQKSAYGYYWMYKKDVKDT